MSEATHKCTSAPDALTTKSNHERNFLLENKKRIAGSKARGAANVALSARSEGASTHMWMPVTNSNKTQNRLQSEQSRLAAGQRIQSEKATGARIKCTTSRIPRAIRVSGKDITYCSNIRDNEFFSQAIRKRVASSEFSSGTNDAVNRVNEGDVVQKVSDKSSKLPPTNKMEHIPGTVSGQKSKSTLVAGAVADSGSDIAMGRELPTRIPTAKLMQQFSTGLQQSSSHRSPCVAEVGNKNVAEVETPPSQLTSEIRQLPKTTSSINNRSTHSAHTHVASKYIICSGSGSDGSIPKQGAGDDAPQEQIPINEAQRLALIESAKKRFETLAEEYNEMAASTQSLQLCVIKQNMKSELNLIEQDLSLFNRPPLYLKRI